MGLGNYRTPVMMLSLAWVCLMYTCVAHSTCMLGLGLPVQADHIGGRHPGRGAVACVAHLEKDRWWEVVDEGRELVKDVTPARRAGGHALRDVAGHPNISFTDTSFYIMCQYI